MSPSTALTRTLPKLPAGVNLGGWLLLEPGPSHELFQTFGPEATCEPGAQLLTVLLLYYIILYYIILYYIILYYIILYYIIFYYIILYYIILCYSLLYRRCFQVFRQGAYEVGLAAARSRHVD